MVSIKMIRRGSITLENTHVGSGYFKIRWIFTGAFNDGCIRTFSGEENTRRNALKAATRRSEELIDKGL